MSPLAPRRGDACRMAPLTRRYRAILSPRAGRGNFAALAIAAGVAAILLWANVPERALPNGAVADRIVVEKSARRLTLYAHGVPLKSYRVALGRQPRASTRSISRIPTAASTRRCTFPIRAPRTARAPSRAATS